jgi:hypothetical protein
VTRVLTIVVAAVALLASTAQAAPPALDLDRANRAAEREAAEWLEFWNWDEDDAYAEDATNAPNYMLRYELDACDRTSRVRAECEVTYALADGDLCDDTIIARTTRRGLLRVWSWGQVCDSEFAA